MRKTQTFISKNSYFSGKYSRGYSKLQHCNTFYNLDKIIRGDRRRSNSFYLKINHYFLGELAVKDESNMLKGDKQEKRNSEKTNYMS